MSLTLTFEGKDDPEWRKQYHKWILDTEINNIRDITPVSTAIFGKVIIRHRCCNKMSLTMTFEGEDDPEWQKQCQKWILHTEISNIRCIIRAYTVRNTKVEFPNMADGGHVGFGHSVIRGVIPEEHLGDFSCLGTHWLSGSEKLPQHHFANGSSGHIMD